MYAFRIAYQDDLFSEGVTLVKADTLRQPHGGGCFLFEVRNEVVAGVNANAIVSIERVPIGRVTGAEDDGGRA